MQWLKNQQREDGAVLSKPDGFPYSEITAYFVQMCLKFDMVEEAVRAANYLTSINRRGFVSWDGSSNLAYSFDTMLCADALMDMFDYSFRDDYYNAAHEMAGRIGSVIDEYNDLPTMSDYSGRFFNNPNVYYGIPGALYLKLIPIFERFDMDTSYLEGLMDLQRDDGGFHCHEVPQKVQGRSSVAEEQQDATRQASGVVVG